MEKAWQAVPQAKFDSLCSVVETSLVETVGAACGVKPVPRGLAETGVPFDGIIGMMSFTGDLPFSLMVGLPRTCATRMVGKFAGFDIDYEGPDMGDAVGEVVNVVAGDLALRLDRIGVRCQLTLPSVARGRDVQPLSLEGQPESRKLLRFEDADFWVRVAALNPRKSA